MNWPLRVRFWRWLHMRVNRLAWRYGLETGWELGMRGAAYHIRHDHWLWRLNTRLGDLWIGWWMKHHRDGWDEDE